MHLGKKRIIGLLFLAAFIIYALSPSVCYIYGLGPVGNALQIISGKLAGSILAHSEGKNNRGVDIIVHKSRTLVPEDSLTRLTYLENTLVSEGCFSIHSIQATFFRGISPFAKVPANGFRFLFSGLSPPAV